MFTFSGTLGRGPFTVALAVRLAILALLLVGVVVFIEFASGGDARSGAYGMIFGTIAFMGGLQLVAAVFLFSLVGIVARRLRDIGVTGWAALFIPLLLVADAQVLLQIALSGAGFNPGQNGISLEWLWRALPKFALLTVVLLGLLCLIPGNATRSPSTIQDAVAGVLAAVIGVFAAIGLTRYAPTLGLRQLTVPYLPLLPFVMVGLVGAVAWLGFAPSGVAKMPRGENLRPPQLPYMLLAVAAVLLAAVATFVVSDFGDDMGIFGVAVSLFPVVAPTALIYFAAMCGVALAIRQRTLGAVVVLVVTLLPLAHWGLDHYKVVQRREAERAVIAALPRNAITIVPGALINEGVNVSRDISRVPGVASVIYRDGEYVARFVGNDRKPQPVTEPLPTDHLLLRVGEASRFRKEDTPYESEGPFELVQVDDGAETLIDAFYREILRPPAYLPVLGVEGWLPLKSGRGSGRHPSVGEFVADALGEDVTIPGPQITTSGSTDNVTP